LGNWNEVTLQIFATQNHANTILYADIGYILINEERDTGKDMNESWK
jgi:hypothetical protein